MSCYLHGIMYAMLLPAVLNEQQSDERVRVFPQLVTVRICHVPQKLTERDPGPECVFPTHKLQHLYGFIAATALFCHLLHIYTETTITICKIVSLDYSIDYTVGFLTIVLGQRDALIPRCCSIVIIIICRINRHIIWLDRVELKNLFLGKVPRVLSEALFKTLNKERLRLYGLKYEKPRCYRVDDG